MSGQSIGNASFLLVSMLLAAAVKTTSDAKKIDAVKTTLTKECEPDRRNSKINNRMSENFFSELLFYKLGS
jgi:hypothetical protein